MTLGKLSKWPIIKSRKSFRRFGVIDVERSEKATNSARILGCLFKKDTTKFCGLQIFNGSGIEYRTDIGLNEPGVQVRQRSRY
jgi:hypothetical protein